MFRGYDYYSTTHCTSEAMEPGPGTPDRGTVYG